MTVEKKYITGAHKLEMLKNGMVKMMAFLLMF
jgi:hypothetical protein